MSCVRFIQTYDSPWDFLKLQNNNENLHLEKDVAVFTCSVNNIFRHARFYINAFTDGAIKLMGHNRFVHLTLSYVQSGLIQIKRPKPYL